MDTPSLNAVALLQVEGIGQHVLSVEPKAVDDFKAPGLELAVGTLVVGFGADLHVLVASSKQLIEEHLVDVTGDASSSKLWLKAAEQRLSRDVLYTLCGELGVLGCLQKPQEQLGAEGDLWCRCKQQEGHSAFEDVFEHAVRVGGPGNEAQDLSFGVLVSFLVNEAEEIRRVHQATVELGEEPLAELSPQAVSHGRRVEFGHPLAVSVLNGPNSDQHVGVDRKWFGHLGLLLLEGFQEGRLRNGAVLSGKEVPHRILPAVCKGLVEKSASQLDGNGVFGPESLIGPG